MGQKLIRVVYGPPGAGKTTYVERHRSEHEPVIDLDKIAEAIGSSRTHGHNPDIYRVAQSARSAAIRRILDNRIPAWIIDTDLATDLIRNRSFLCSFILVDPGIETTRTQAKAAGRHTASLKHIDEWYANPPQPPEPTPYGTPGARSDTIRKRARATLARTKAACHICGQPIDYKLKWPDPMCFVADHVIPLDKGGADHIGNMAAAHATCNSKKRARIDAPVIRRSASLD